MALTSTQKAQLAVIVGVSNPENLEDRLVLLTPSQETILGDDIARYMVIRNEFGSLSGGKSGVKFSYADGRKAIKRDILTMLSMADEPDSYSNISTLILRG